MKKTSLVVIYLLINPLFVFADVNWASHPVIKSEGCESLEYKDVVDFMANQYYPAVNNIGDKTAAKQLVQTYSMASSLVLRSQECLAHALKLKELTKELQQTQQLISSGTSMSKQEIEKHRELTIKANEQITEAANKIKQLSPVQQKSFSFGTSTFLTGTYATAKLLDMGKNYVGNGANALSNVTQGNWTSAFGEITNAVKSLTSGDSGMIQAIFSGFKDHATNIYSTSKFLIQYSKDNNIKLPTDATKDLANVADWI